MRGSTIIIISSSLSMCRPAMPVLVPVLVPVQMQRQLPVHTIDLLDVTHARAHCEREKTEKTQQSTLLYYYSDTESTALNKSEEGRKAAAAAKKPSSPRRALYAAAAAAAWPPKRRTLPPPPLLEWLGNASAERRIASQSESDSIQRVSRGSSSVLRAQQTAFGASSLLEEREREREPAL